MNKKVLEKIGLIFLLIIVIAFIVIVAINAASGKKEVATKNATDNLRSSNEETTNVQEVDKTPRDVTINTTETGTEYVVASITPELVVGTKYYGTQLADINNNFSNYDGKTIELEGMNFTNGTFKFCGRYATTSLCPGCPPGICYLEYEWYGNQTPEIIDEDTWIKVKGTLKEGRDQGIPYYYIDAASIEVMNEKGENTVEN